MKRTSLQSILFASIVLAPLTSSASLLVGFHDFDGTSANESADYTASTGFSGSVNKGGTISENKGGSNDNYYGDSSTSVLGSVSPGDALTQDGHIKVQQGRDVTFSFGNTSGASVPLASLFFDAAFRDSADTVLRISYQIGAGSLVEVVNGTVGSLTPAMGKVAVGSYSLSANYTDYALDLIGLTLGHNESIKFIFSITRATGAPELETIRLDNIGLTAVPEPGSFLALGSLVGAGCLLRSRRRSAVAAA